MDLSIIGKFIKQQRKAKGLTQVELAEKIMVNEKTISKWECGNGFPDSSLILPLCKELDISANELLSGKKLLNEEYKDMAEDNLLMLIENRKKTTHFLLFLEYLIGYLSSALLFTLVFVSSFVNMETWLRIVLIVVGFVNFVIGIYFCLVIEKDAGFYECKHCHNKYIPSYNQILWSMHFGRIRYMKCPKCNRKSWQNKVIK